MTIHYPKDNYDATAGLSVPPVILFDLEELSAFTGLGFVCAHLNNHSEISGGMLARLRQKSKNALFGNLVTLWKLML